MEIVLKMTETMINLKSKSEMNLRLTDPSCVQTSSGVPASHLFRGVPAVPQRKPRSDDQSRNVLSGRPTASSRSHHASGFCRSEFTFLSHPYGRNAAANRRIIADYCR